MSARVVPFPVDMEDTDNIDVDLPVPTCSPYLAGTASVGVPTSSFRALITPASSAHRVQPAISWDANAFTWQQSTWEDESWPIVDQNQPPWRMAVQRQFFRRVDMPTLVPAGTYILTSDPQEDS